MLLYREHMPKLDLHGKDREITRILVKEFLYDEWRMRERDVAIIHGIGTGALKEEVLRLLKNNPYVEEYSIDPFNSGCTLVRLKAKIDKDKLF